jgi:hypothetical protein
MVKGLLASPFTTFESVRGYFPEYFDPFEGAEDEEGNFDPDKVDESQLGWATPESPEDDEALSRWIAERESGSMSAADFD